jgi:hypothetical protein
LLNGTPDFVIGCEQVSLFVAKTAAKHSPQTLHLLKRGIFGIFLLNGWSTHTKKACCCILSNLSSVTLSTCLQVVVDRLGADKQRQEPC